MNVRSDARAAAGSVVGLICLASTALALTPVASLSTFPTEPEAKRHCPSDVVVWLNAETGTFYYRDQRWYATTTGGVFACRNDVSRSDTGDWAFRNGQ
jgi:hypothetical protein